MQYYHENSISYTLENNFEIPPLPSTEGFDEFSDVQLSLHCLSPRGDAPFGAKTVLQMPGFQVERKIYRERYSFGTSPITDPASAVTECPSSELASSQPDRLVLDDTHSSSSLRTSAVCGASYSTSATATDTTSRQSPTTPDE
jgi:hypothetical protein